MRIYKYMLITNPSDDLVHLELPACYQIVDFKEQAGALYIWCLIDEQELRRVVRSFKIVGTGHDIPVGTKYIKTVHTELGFVWHLFMYCE